MYRRKNIVLWIWLVVTLLVSTAIVSIPIPALNTVLSADMWMDPSSTPGSYIYINIYVDDVEAMWGYQFTLYYNTTILNATDRVSNYPFEAPQGSPPGGEINDTAGYVTMVYSMPMAEPYGFYTDFPYPIATIEFVVDAVGSSLLHLGGPPPGNVPIISDIHGAPIYHDVIDGFFSNVDVVPHDIAVTAINVSPTRDIMPGEIVSINVTVANQAPFSETFNVTAYANSTVVDSTNVTLAQLESNITQLTWDTTGFAFGPYNIHAEASVVTNETDTADNTLTFGDIVIIGIHDIAVTNVTASPTEVATGDLISINVTVNDQGNFTESFNATAKYGYVDPWPEVSGEHIIGTKAVTSMANGTSRILTFTWNTSDVAFNYPLTSVSLWIDANVSKAGEPAVPYETNTANNRLQMVGNVTVWLTGPAASFTYSPLVPFESGTVTFDASGSYSVDSNITGYKWDFDDGNITEVTVPIIKHVYAENGTYTVSLTVTDDKGLSRTTKKIVTVYRRDIAIVSVVPSLTEVAVGESVSISVTVVNQGDYGAETFNVTAYYDNTTINTLTVTNLAVGASQTLTFTWDTTGVSPGTYTVKAVATVVPGEIRIEDNTYTFDGTVAVLIHDIAVTNVTASPTEVATGDLISINVTVVNQGDYGAETFNVTAYYDNTTINTLTVTNLAVGASQTLTFTWNTTDVSSGTYTLKAVATPVPGETDTADNTKSGPTVTINPATGPGISPYVWVGIGVAIAAVALLVSFYLLRVRKPK